MKTNNKVRWIVGITGVAFSAFVIGQLDQPPMQQENVGAILTDANDSMSKREKELVQLDWSNFTISQGVDRSEFTTRRS